MSRPFPVEKTVSASSEPSTIAVWLAGAIHRLAAADIASARLDAELLLAYSLGCERTWLVAHQEFLLTGDVLGAATSALDRRLQREPLAYITGWQEFYGRQFQVTPDSLIPRPETESLVEMALNCLLPGDLVLDVGTGSGCIAISLALEYPTARVKAIDISESALKVATNNAARLEAKVEFWQQELDELGPYTDAEDIARKQAYQLLVANLPYVDHQWHCSPETAYEPARALFAEEEGLALIFRLITIAPRLLSPHGHLLLEADKRQHTAIIDFAKQAGWQTVAQTGLALHLQRA